MRRHLWRHAGGAVALGVIAGTAALALPGTTASWQPERYGLSVPAARLLPAEVSGAAPVRVVSTTLDRTGRPVVAVRTATDGATAVSLVEDAQRAENALGVEVDAVVRALDETGGTDPYRHRQWGLATIGAAAAWRQSTGAGVTVAVIDTGVDAAHPDLAGQVLTGYDVITRTAGAGTDPNGHGTHVAGTIAAVTGNGTGVSAVAPDARILPIRVLDADGSGYMSDAATGIVYAADHGAQVINMSLGSAAPVAAVRNAVAYARAKGVTVIAAAGNERQDGSPASYPAADAGVVAVAATDSFDEVAYYSTRGGYVDVAAPGSAVHNTYPGDRYATMSGTSMAAPHVAGVAALLAAYGAALTPDQIEAALTGSAVDLGAAGRDADHGYGRVDAVAALAAVARPAVTAPATSAPAAEPPTTPVATTPAATLPATASPSPAATTPATASPTPTATVVPAPTRTTAERVRLVITVSPNTRVPYGSTATVRFTVTAGSTAWARQPVRVGVAEGSGAFGYRDATTDDAGRVVVSRTATAHLRVRLVVVATDRSAAVTSPASVVTVQARAVLASRSTGSLTATVSGAAGPLVRVQWLSGSRWVTVSQYAAAPTRTITGLVTGQRYRVVVPGTAEVTGVTSAVVRVS